MTSILAPLTQVEPENRSSPSITTPKDQVQSERRTASIPAHSGFNDRMQAKEDPDPDGDDLIRPTSEPKGATETMFRTGDIKSRRHQGDTQSQLTAGYLKVEFNAHRTGPKGVSSMQAEADATAGNSEEMLASIRTHSHRGSTIQRGTNAVIVNPHLSAYNENTGVVPIAPVKSSEEPPSINVTIGRIEVKASRVAVSEQPRKQKKPSGVMSLDKYLGQFKRGGR
jgi:hypothetical protein